MKFVRIVDGKVDNIIELDHEPVFHQPGEQERWREVSDGTDVDLGWTAHQDGSFTAPVIPSAVPAVPLSVSRAQAKIQLHRAGLLDAVKTAVSADPELEIWFEDALVWQRDNEHVTTLGEGAMGLTSVQIDELFVAAAQIAA